MEKTNTELILEKLEGIEKRLGRIEKNLGYGCAKARDRKIVEDRSTKKVRG